jgi:glycosyltransferase involved in cell wall biosynthesis
MIRVAIVSAHALSAYVGGTEKLVEMLCTEFSEQNVEIHRFATNHSNLEIGNKANPNPERKVTDHYLPYFYILQRPLNFNLLFELLKNKPDIIHLYTPFPTGEISAFLASKILKVPLITTYVMDAILDGPQGYLQINKSVERIYNSFSIGLLRRSAAIIFLNASYIQRSKYAQYLWIHNRQHFILHQGTDTKIYKPLDPAIIDNFKLKLGMKDSFIILFVGRLVPYKGVGDLIIALKTLSETHRNSRVLVVGDGPFKKNLETETRNLNLENKVTFTGFVSDSELVYYYNIADVVVLPSKSMLENVPLTLLEAMACGKPVIHYDVGGAADQITHGEVGFLVPSDDFRALTKAIEYLIVHCEDRKKMGENARKYAESIDWKILSSKLLEIYEKTITTHKNRDKDFLKIHYKPKKKICDMKAK